MPFRAIVPKRAIVNAEVGFRAQQVMRQFVGAVQRDVSNYPPQQPTPYRRTGTLGRGSYTKVEVRGGDLVGSVVNTVTYAPFVIGRDRQARVMKAKGWRTIEQIGEMRWPATRSQLREVFRGRR